MEKPQLAIKTMYQRVSVFRDVPVLVFYAFSARARIVDSEMVKLTTCD